MPIKEMSLAEFLEYLKEKQGNQPANQFAKSIGITPQYMCDVYSGRRPPSDAILAAVNAERSLVYTVVIPTERKEEKK